MKIRLEKSSGRAYCRNKDCSFNPDYISDKGRIKKDTTCAAITMDSSSGMNTSFYCRECIDKIYENMKKILNPALWAFH